MASSGEKTGLASWAAAGAAVLASTCCLIAPVLAALGFGCAWAAHLEMLEAYRPVLIAAAVVGLFFAYRGIFRPGQACTAQGRRGQKVLFWIVASVVAVGLILEAMEKNKMAFEGKDALSAESGTTEMAVRKRMPELAFVDLDGKPWKLSDQRDRVVLLNFWAPWCPPCRKEMPALMELWKQDRAKGLDVAGVVMDEDGVERARRFIREHHIEYPILLPGTGARLTPSVDRLPTTFLIDRQGRLAAIYAGGMEESVFHRDVESLLAER